MKNLNKKKGFTIVELVIVIAVIAILAAVLIPTFSNVANKAKDSAAVQNARNAYMALLEASEEGDVADDIVFFDEDNDRYVAVKDGQLDTTKVSTAEDAEAAIEEFFGAGKAYTEATINGVTYYIVTAA